jgi:hypothetical protein
VGWLDDDRFNLKAPILNFTIQQLLQDDSRDHFAEVLKSWIEYDIANLARIRAGIPHFFVPSPYETNKLCDMGTTRQGGRFRSEFLPLAENRTKELLGVLATHYFRNNDLVSAAIYAMALRHLSPADYSAPTGPNDPGMPHDLELHNRLNRFLGIEPAKYVYEACDSLLKLVKDELARHPRTE